MSQRFISETDIAANKQKLQEAWNATKGEDDPEEPPEQPAPDSRALFHRLEEQRMKKQDEYDDAHKLKNMVRGLEDDEVQFLDLVDKTKIEQERRVRIEETDALLEFRKKRAEMELAISTEKMSTVTQISPSHTARPAKNSQKSLLIGAIKRKGDPCDQDNPSKKRRTDSNQPETTDTTLTNSDVAKSQTPLGPNGYLKFAGTLPGLGSYSDSSDSDLSSSDSEQESRHIRIVHRHRKGKKGGCC